MTTSNAALAELDQHIAGLTPATQSPRVLDAPTVRALAQKYGAQYGVDPAILYGMARTETGRDGKSFNASAVSKAGAQGLMQFVPGTAAQYGIDPMDPEQAMDGAARYMRDALKLFGGDTTKAVASYNAGPGNVRNYGGVPPFKETQDYVRLVNQFAGEERGQQPTAQPGRIDQMRATADSYLGTPYQWGGNSKQGIDCSAFISQVWGVPRQTTDSLSNVASALPKDQLQPGDALNLPTYKDPRGYGHVRMFDGWADPAHTTMYVYESAGATNGVARRVIPYDDTYQPMRLNAFAAEQAPPAAPAIPGVNDRSAPDPTGSTVRDPSDASAGTLASNGFSTPPATTSTGPTGPSTRDATSRDDWRLEPHPDPSTDLSGGSAVTAPTKPLGVMDLEKALTSMYPAGSAPPALQSPQDDSQADPFAYLLDPMRAPLVGSRSPARRGSSFPFSLGVGGY